MIKKTLGAGVLSALMSCSPNPQEVRELQHTADSLSKQTKQILKDPSYDCFASDSIKMTGSGFDFVEYFRFQIFHQLPHKRIGTVDGDYYIDLDKYPKGDIIPVVKGSYLKDGNVYARVVGCAPKSSRQY